MSNSIEGVRSMVEAMDRTGKLCQIGHQRRSNSRYKYTHEKTNMKKFPIPSLLISTILFSACSNEPAVAVDPSEPSLASTPSAGQIAITT